MQKNDDTIIIRKHISTRTSGMWRAKEDEDPGLISYGDK